MQSSVYAFPSWTTSKLTHRQSCRLVLCVGFAARTCCFSRPSSSVAGAMDEWPTFGDVDVARPCDDVPGSPPTRKTKKKPSRMPKSGTRKTKKDNMKRQKAVPKAKGKARVKKPRAKKPSKARRAKSDTDDDESSKKSEMHLPDPMPNNACRPPRAAAPRLGACRVASDCSGLCTEVLAAKAVLVGSYVEHVFASETCRYARTVCVCGCMSTHLNAKMHCRVHFVAHTWGVYAFQTPRSGTF